MKHSELDIIFKHRSNIAAHSKNKIINKIINLEVDTVPSNLPYIMKG